MEKPVTYDVEIVLREQDAATTVRLEVAAEPRHWSEAHAAGVLRDMLLAIDRTRNPTATDRYVALRGFSWIVEPVEGGVVIAIEIPSGAAVAGPFDIDQRVLDAMITRVLAAAARPTVVH
jgi:hypothetical protein